MCCLVVAFCAFAYFGSPLERIRGNAWVLLVTWRIGGSLIGVFFCVIGLPCVRFGYGREHRSSILHFFNDSHVGQQMSLAYVLGREARMKTF